MAKQTNVAKQVSARRKGQNKQWEDFLLAASPYTDYDQMQMLRRHLLSQRMRNWKR